MMWIKRLGGSGRLRLLSVLGAVLCLSASGWWLHARDHRPTRTSRPFRIGFQHSPPYQDVAPDGSPFGPAIEIVRTAARRRNIPLEWVHVPDGPESALRSGRVDLWPLLADL